VQPCPARRALKPSTGSSDLLGTATVRTLDAAVALAPITAAADLDLNMAAFAQTIENAIRLLDHWRPTRQFLDKRRRGSDTSLSSRDHAAPLKARTVNPGFRLL